MSQTHFSARRSLKDRLFSTLIFATAIALAGCGGGGGGQDNWGGGPSVAQNAPAAPTAVSYTAASATAITLTWASVPGATSYEVFGSKNPCSTTSFVSRGTTTTPTFTASPNSTGDTCYRVKACNVAGCSALSPAATAAPAASVAVSTTAPENMPAGQTASLSSNVKPSAGASIVSYAWTQTGGSGGTLRNANQAVAAFEAPLVTAPTPFTFTLTVRDSAGKSSSSTVTITVTPVGNPVVKTFKGRNAVTGDTVSLHAQCKVAGGSPVYSWRQVSPAAPLVVLTNPTSADPTFTAPSVSGLTPFDFDVSCSDSADPTNKRAIAKTRVNVNYATPLPPTSSAGMTAGGPLTLVAPTVNSVPPQVLTLQTAPPATVVAGLAVKLSIPASGGTQPYTWSWTQTGGPTAAIANANTAVPTITAPSVSAQTTLTFRGTVTDGAAASKSADVTVTVIPAPTLQPLSAFITTQYYVDEGQPVVLGAQVSGGNGNYTYAWVQKSGTPVTLADANTSHPTFTAPAVTATTQLGFEVTVRDTAGNGGGTLKVGVQVNNLSLSQNVATTSDVVTNSGASTTLNFPKPKGGRAPFTYAVSQSSGTAVTLSSTSVRNPSFTAPTLGVGAPDQTLTFVLTVTDALGNTVQGTENVVVKAPAPPLAASLTGPDSADQGATISLNAGQTGGTSPYTYSYAVSGGSVTIPATANPSVVLPSIAAGGSPITLTITLTVTDGAATTATAVKTVTVNAPPAPVAPPPATGGGAGLLPVSGLTCVQCGEPEFSVPCSSMELLFDAPEPCPTSGTARADGINVNNTGSAACMIDAATDSFGDTAIYKRCVDGPTCHLLWYLESSDQNVCRNFDSVTTDVSCHFCFLGSEGNVGSPNNPDDPSNRAPLYDGRL